jgi:hypothetical protein
MGAGGFADGGPPSGGPGGGLAACDQTATLYCQHEFECFPDSVERYGTVEFCAALDAANCRRFAGLSGASPKFATEWVACNRALAAATCDEARFGLVTPACEVTPGIRPQGAGCTAVEQCSTGNCAFDLDPVTGVSPDCGICAPLIGEGQPCPGGSWCGHGLACDPDAGGDATCLRLVPEGAECGGMNRVVCAGQLTCIGGRCSRPLPAGEACASDPDCQGDLACRAGRCGPPPKAGDACDPMRDVDDCGLKLYCAMDGACVVRKSTGDACTYDLECASLECSANGSGRPGICATGTGTSVPVGVGEPCSLDLSKPDDDGFKRYCTGLAHCDHASQRCVRSKIAGDPCATEEECLYPWTCEAGKCAARPEMMCRDR